jgi:hypothetical protein
VEVNCTEPFPSVRVPWGKKLFEDILQMTATPSKYLKPVSKEGQSSQLNGVLANLFKNFLRSFLGVKDILS